MKALFVNRTYNKQTILSRFCPKRGSSVYWASASVYRVKRAPRETESPKGKRKSLRFTRKVADNQSGNRVNSKIYIEKKNSR